METIPAIRVENVSYAYGERKALDGVSLQVAAGEVYGLLGPNGGGKSTLFRLLATLLPLRDGQAWIEGVDVAREPDRIRRLIGVTFQSPSLDAKLTVRENLACQGRLYGLSGDLLRRRIETLSETLEVADRLGDLVETLSGGLKRRVEVAKSLLHEPRVLLLDEPSTGLDPGIRHELWRVLQSLAREQALTILVTTHLLDEAERCCRLAILDRGRIVTHGAPDVLRSAVGGDCLSISAASPEILAARIREELGLSVRIINGQLHLEQRDGHELVREIMTRFGSEVRSVTLGRPTLEDVFIHHTGRRLDEENPNR